MKNFIKLIEAMRSIAIIALVAIIGFSFVSCKEGGGNDPLNGTWVNSEMGAKVVLNNGSITMSILDDEESFVEGYKGTYSTSGNNITITITQVSGAMLEYFGVDGFSASQWYTKQQIKDVLIQAALDDGMSQADAEEIVDEIMADMQDQIFSPFTGTLSDNTLTFTMWGEPQTFTKQ